MYPSAKNIRVRTLYAYGGGVYSRVVKFVNAKIKNIFPNYSFSKNYSRSDNGLLYGLAKKFLTVCDFIAVRKTDERRVEGGKRTSQNLNNEEDERVQYAIL